MRYAPTPGDFTAEERFAMFRKVLHDHVWPAAEFVARGSRLAYSWSYSVPAWRREGRRAFLKRVQTAARAELADADYAIYDLRPLRCIVGNDGPRFCRLLKALDCAEMKQRMNGLVADLAVIDRKLDAVARSHEAFDEIRYRIDFYDNSFEAVIRGGKGGWLWTTCAP